MVATRRACLLLGLLAITLPAFADAPAATSNTTPGDDVLYDDPTATSSANVVQIYPNSNKDMTIYSNVRRIRIKGDVLILEWGQTAVTLLPRQFVGAITLNRRVAPAGAATAPAPSGYVPPPQHAQDSPAAGALAPPAPPTR